MRFYLNKSISANAPYDPYWDDTSQASHFGADVRSGPALETVTVTPVVSAGTGLKATLVRQYVSGGYFGQNGTLTGHAGDEPAQYYLGGVSLFLKASTTIAAPWSIGSVPLRHNLAVRCAVVSSDLSTIRARCVISTVYWIPEQSVSTVPSWCQPIAKFFFNALGHANDFNVSIGDRLVFEVGILAQTFASGVSAASATLVFGSPHPYDVNGIVEGRGTSGAFNGFASIGNTTMRMLLSEPFDEVRYSRPFAATHKPDRIQFPSVAPSGMAFNTWMLNWQPFVLPPPTGYLLNTAPLNARSLNT